MPVSDHDDSVWPDSYDRRIRFPVSPEMLQGMSVGDEVTVTITGTVKSTSQTADDGENRNYLEVMASGVEAYSDMDMDTDEEFASGFDNKEYD